MNPARHLRAVMLAAGLAVLPMSRAADGDWQQWSEASWTQNIGHSLDLGLRWEGRWEEGMSRFAYFETEPVLTWRHSPRWDFTLGYERDERIAPMGEVDHVPNVSATARLPRQPWRLFPTLDWRFDNRFRADFMVPEETGRDWTPVYRNRSEMEGRWKVGAVEMVPFLFDEWFLDMKDGALTQNRMGVGLGWPILRHWMVRAYWMRLDEKIAGAWEWHPVTGIQVWAQF